MQKHWNRLETILRVLEGFYEVAGCGESLKGIGSAPLFDPKQESRESYFTVELPRQLLPQELKEGDYLTATWQLDREATESARERVTAILERLANRHHK